MTCVNEYLPGTIGERIEDLLSGKRISHAKLAKAIHISEATMSRYIHGTSEIPCDVLLDIARFFHVTTDFLLGATNIPYKTNFDIDRLGLTEAAAKKMLSGALNMDVLNKLLINEDFAILTEQIAQYADETNRGSLAVMNKVLQVAGNTVTKHAKTTPADKAVAARVIRDIRSSMVPPQLPDTAAMELTWSRILAYLRDGAETRTRENVKLTSDIMEKLAETLEARKGTFDLHSTTINDIVGAITEVVVASGYPAEEKDSLEKSLQTMFMSFIKSQSRR
ncbi:MAG: helix-turn-helix domain-containing protein [Aristaeellaceae bacterium]